MFLCVHLGGGVEVLRGCLVSILALGSGSQQDLTWCVLPPEFPSPAPVISVRIAPHPTLCSLVPAPHIPSGSRPLAAPPGATQGAAETLGLPGQAAEGPRCLFWKLSIFPQYFTFVLLFTPC